LPLAGKLNPGRPACSPVTIQTNLHRLHIDLEVSIISQWLNTVNNQSYSAEATYCLIALSRVKIVPVLN